MKKLGKKERRKVAAEHTFGDTSHIDFFLNFNKSHGVLGFWGFVNFLGGLGRNEFYIK